MDAFKVGDRVVRKENVYEENSRILHGTVTRCYAETYPGCRDDPPRHYPELYEVKWDEKPEPEKGFLSHGLRIDDETKAVRLNVEPSEIDELDRLQQEAGGISCVRDIVRYLRRGQFQDAQSVRSVEGDKTRGHPAVEAQLYKMFGCRMHGVRGCDYWLCERK
jgi:hypothetical protein